MTLTDAPASARVYEKRSHFKTSINKLAAFHEAPSALAKLTPPPMFMQLIRDDRTSMISGELEFRLWFGPVPIRWLARHEPGPTPTSFADRMINGPMAYWRHEHIFEQTDDGVLLRDRVTLAHKNGLAGVLTRLMFDGVPLRILFFYRHLRTRLAMK